MQQSGKYIIIFGIIIIIVGIIVVAFGDKLKFFGRLPGDIRIEKNNFKFYFPLTTCILISLLLTLIMFLVRKK